jgi:glycosyltransferase involved in cell wall biosynthesis
VTPVRASIVIRTYNEARHLPELLDAIGSQSLGEGERETIVVDSGSTDATLHIAREHGCRIVHIAREEFSFGRSLNLGCAAASGRVLVFISGHCVPGDPVWLENLVSPVERGDADLTYGRQLGGERTRFSEHQIFRKYFPAKSGRQPNGFFCNNANAAVRRSAWESFRFDETLTGLEDLHLGKRLVEAGGRVAYVPSAAVLHHHDETWSQVTRRFEREALALQSIMPEIHIGSIIAARYFAAATWGDWRRARNRGVLLRNAWPVVAYRFSQYYGSWKGNHSHRRMSRDSRERYFYPHDSHTPADRPAANEGAQRPSSREELQGLRG